MISLEKMLRQYLQGVPKNVLIECCWSQGVWAPSPVVGTTWAWKMFFLSFLTKTKQDHAPPSHVHGKFGPTALHFGYDFVLLMHFLGHPVQPQNYLHPPIWLRFRYYPSKTDLELKTGHPPPNISVYIVSKRKTASHFGIEQRNR